MTDLTLQLPAEVVEAIAQRVAEILAPRLEHSPAPPLMTIAEAAEFLRCKDRQRVDDLLSSGRLTRHKDGSRTLVSRAELVEYVGCPAVAGNGKRPRPERVRVARG